jgi:SAM-dependent methyltransferase
MKISVSALALTLVATSCWTSNAFVPSSKQASLARSVHFVGQPKHSKTSLHMGLDLVTYLRLEWISAALCTNQTPRSADVCLQLGTEDGRAVTFIPRTIRELITSSAERDGKLTVTARRQLKQQADRRQAAVIKYCDQAADNLVEVEDGSVDIVISMQAAARMLENGQDWKKSVRESARVLKPGGRLLFVEQTELNGESYGDYLNNLYTAATVDPGDAKSIGPDDDDSEDELEYYPVFEELVFDNCDLVLTPHIAGVATKSQDAALTAEERLKKEMEDEKDRLADLSLTAFERGIKKRRKKKVKKGAEAK